MEFQSATTRTTHFTRYGKILGILVKYGFEDTLAHSGLKKLIPKSQRLLPKRNGQVVFEINRYERIRLAFEELGPTFIKFGQILSNRPDLLPEELIAELEKLQDKVPPFSGEEAIQKLERELDCPIDAVFESIDHVALASASIGQVHKARLLNGEDVVVKIQRPNIRKVIYEDIQIMKDLAGVLSNNFSDIAMLEPLELVRMFERTIKNELDYITEAANILRFTNNFQKDRRIYIPKVYKQYTTQKVLCMEYVEGCKITDIPALKARGVDPKELARTGIDLYFKQVFEHGFFHADPHAGNVFIMEDGKVCFIDFGMMGTLMEEDQMILSNLLYYVHEKNTKKLAQTIQQMAKENEIPQYRDFIYRIEDYLNELDIVSVSDVDISQVVGGLQDLMFEYKVFLPRNFHFLLRALIIIDGIGLYLDPDYKIMDHIKPYAERLMKRKYDPAKMMDAALTLTNDFANLAMNFPTDARVILNKMKKGRLHFEFEHKGLNDFYAMLDVISNRISFSIVVGSLIIASSLLVISKIPPLYNEVSVIGIIGFIIAFLLALRLAWSILKHGRF